MTIVIWDFTLFQLLLEAGGMEDADPIGQLEYPIMAFLPFILFLTLSLLILCRNRNVVTVLYVRDVEACWRSLIASLIIWFISSVYHAPRI